MSSLPYTKGPGIGSLRCCIICCRWISCCCCWLNRLWLESAMGTGTKRCDCAPPSANDRLSNVCTLPHTPHSALFASVENAFCTPTDDLKASLSDDSRCCFAGRGTIVAIFRVETSSLALYSCRAHLLRLRQLDGAGLEVCEGALHQAALLLEVRQQRVPQRIFGQHLGVAKHHQAEARPRQGHVQPAGVTQEPDSLQRTRPRDGLPSTVQPGLITSPQMLWVRSARSCPWSLESPRMSATLFWLLTHAIRSRAALIQESAAWRSERNRPDSRNAPGARLTGRTTR